MDPDRAPHRRRPRCLGRRLGYHCGRWRGGRIRQQRHGVCLHQRRALTATLVPSGKSGGDFFGNRAIGISGDTIIVGAPAHGAVGSAFVFNNTSGTIWQQVGDLANADSNRGDSTGTAVANSSFGA